jgi:hypothetical protein
MKNAMKNERVDLLTQASDSGTEMVGENGAAENSRK